MRVIIAGGTGLIGRALARDLAADGHELIVLSRRPERPVAGLPAGLRLVGWDARSAAGWGDWVEGAGAVVNLAGESIGEGRWSAARKARIRESRVRAGQAVAEAIAAATAKPGVLVQASAVGYYGTTGEAWLDEDAPAGEGFLASVCRDWEASTAGVEALGVRRVITRTGIVLSPEGGALPRMLLPFRLFAGGPIGTGRQRMPWIHLDDVVGAIRFLIATPEARGAINLSAPEPSTNAEFGRVLGRVLGRPAWLPAPAFALKLALGEQAEIVLEGQRTSAAKLLGLGYRFRYEQLEPALRAILARGDESRPAAARDAA